MKKKLFALLCAVLAATFVFVGCSQFDGNYKEATAEQKTAAMQKVETAMESEGTFGQEITAKLKVNVTGGSADDNGEVSLEMSGTNDVTNKTAKVTLKLNADMAGEKGTMNATAYVDTDKNVAYMDYSMAANGTSASAKIKMEVGLEDIMGMANMFGGMAGAAGEFTDALNPETIGQFLNNDQIKVYVDGENKVKLEMSIIEGMTFTFYYVAGDKDFSMKYEIKGASTYEGITMNVDLSYQMVPSNSKVSLPSNTDEYQSVNPFANFGN